MGLLKIIKETDLDHCWCCDNTSFIKSGDTMLFYDCLSCYDFSANISNNNNELIIYLHNIINFDGEFNTTINKISLFQNKIHIIIEHESSDGLAYENHPIIKDTLSIRQFKKLNLKDYILKILDNYKRNMLFV